MSFPFLEELPWPLSVPLFEQRGKPSIRFFGSDGGGVTTSLPFLKASSCLLVAFPVLDLDMFDVLLLWLASLLGLGLVV